MMMISSTGLSLGFNVFVFSIFLTTFIPLRTWKGRS
ncbi:unnamed protein product [Brugia timori]|uniref:Uncharacterized protein n=1 Tax=Brugia timori TaxID=42155 RepID=A0A0R3QNQ9_9BILA|nr:unnamed protein product [Brugia timori]